MQRNINNTVERDDKKTLPFNFRFIHSYNGINIIEIKNARNISEIYGLSSKYEKYVIARKKI